MKEISVEDLKQRVDSGEKLNVLDVRELDEYNEYNIGAQHIPLGNIMNMMIDDIEELKEQEVIVHCRSGKRSMQACMVLEQAGFANLVNVTGGALAWQEKYGDAKLS